jgi:hypothetical protein
MPQIITNAMPLGSPGDLTRDVRECTIEAYYQNVALPVGGYGLPVKLGAVPMSVSPIITGDTAPSIIGLLVREYPAMGGAPYSTTLGVAVPPLSGALGILKRGYMCVKLGGAAAAVKEGIVYVRVAAAAGGKPIGGIEAAADSTNTIILTGAQFMGPADADGNAEIRYNI